MAGSDDISVAATLMSSAVLDGSAGNDTLAGGAGDDCLPGEAATTRWPAGPGTACLSATTRPTS